MSKPRTGKCLCGQSHYDFTGVPEFSIQCYCRDCQHVSGGGHAPQFAVKRDTLTYSGPIKFYQGKSDSGNSLEFGFCSECGSPLLKKTSKLPEMIFIYAGSLDDPENFTIEMKVYEDRRLPWDES